MLHTTRRARKTRGYSDRSFGYTAAFAIMVSLLVSFTLTPMLCSRFLRPSDVAHDKESTKDSWLFRSELRLYRGLRDHGVAVSFLHADADALLAFPAAFRCCTRQGEHERLVVIQIGASAIPRPSRSWCRC